MHHAEGYKPETPKAGAARLCRTQFLTKTTKVVNTKELLAEDIGYRTPL